MRRAKPSRLRRLMALGLLAFGVVAVASWWGLGWWCGGSRQRVCEWDAIERVEVRGMVRLSPDEVRRWAAVPPGARLVPLDASAVVARLSGRPWVRSVGVHKRFPDTLVVTIAERVPIAIAKTDRRSWLIDDEGTVITSTALDAGFPVVIGGSVSRPSGLAVAAALLRGYRAAGSPHLGSGGPVIDVSSPGDPVVQLAGGLRLRFGRGDYEAKWRRYLAIQRDVMERAPGPQLVDLRFRDRAVVMAQGAL